MDRSRILFSLAVVLAAQPPMLRAQQVAEVQLAPGTVRLAVGERRELLATAYDARGDNIATARFVWVSSNPAVVVVEADPSVPGIAAVVGVAEGIATIEAKVGNRSASAAIQVSAAGVAPGPIAAAGAATVLQIEPGSVFLLPTEDVDLRVRFLTDDGSPTAPSEVNWRSLTPDIATVSPQGSVVGLTPGQGVVEVVSASGLIARVTVQVAQTPFGFDREILGVSPQLSDTVRVVVPEQNDRRLEPRRLTWRSTDVTVARVSPIGVVTGVGAGQAELVVSGYGQQSRLPVTVHRPVEFLDLLPQRDRGPVAVPLGGSIGFSATARAADETPVPEAPVTWLVRDTAVASFDPATGKLTGKVLGRTELTVRAPGEGLEGTWQINVIEGGLALEAGRLTLGRAERRRLVASFTDQDGTPVSEATGVTWTSTDPLVVEVDADGNLDPVGYGTAGVVVSTPWGSSDTATVYVLGQILVTYARADGSADLYSFDPGQPELLHQVTDQPGAEYDARFSSDGTRLVYVSDRRGNFDILIADADGSNPVQLNTTVSVERSPCWTPDGERIVYESDAGGVPQIWIMNADGSQPRQLTHGDEPNRQPVISPNGQTIAFTSVRDGESDLYLMNLDGSNQRNFTSSDQDETNPAWIGDSSLVYVVSERRGRVSSQRVERMNFTREVSRLSPEGLMVEDYAVAPAADILAVVVVAEGPSGRENRLYILPLTGDAVPSQVHPESAADRLLSPVFRP
ncbi:MAG: PD40 domain-containing protein [Gemmatimonadota bacterium]|nr:MAG: PD40 domain-containing protein [Gemmatimonadota bacterium]